jgi:ATP-dependent Clp protease ATP-binding subunit ClpA
MTTNAGVMERRRSVGFVEDAARGAETRVAVEALKQGGFPPELLGRISAIIPYRSLEAEDYSVIANRELDRIGAKLSEEGRTLKLNDPSLPAKRAVEWANSGLGAREVIRRLQRLIVDPVSKVMAENPDLWGDCKEVRVERLPSREEAPSLDWVTDPDGTLALVI